MKSNLYNSNFELSQMDTKYAFLINKIIIHVLQSLLSTDGNEDL